MASVPKHKSFETKPEDYWNWSANNNYRFGDIAWYEGIFYVYVGEAFDEPTGVPTTDVYDMMYQGGTGSPTSPQLRSERAWVMLDPGTFPYQNYNGNTVQGPVAAVTSANIRGFRALAFRPIGADSNYIKGKAAYEGDVGHHTASRSLTEASWSSNYDLGYMSKEYGQADIIPPSGTVKGQRSVKDKYYLVSGFIPPTNSNDYWNIDSNGGSQVISPFATDNEYNQGWLDSRRVGTTNGPINDSIAVRLTQDFIYRIGFGLNASATPLGLTMVAGMLGTKVAYKLIFEYYTYVEVSVPPPFIGGTPTTILYRSGGSLVQVSGNGTTTPRVYEWQPPYDEIVQDVVETGEYTLNSSVDGFDEVTIIEETYTVTNEPWKYVNRLVLYDTLDPEQPN